MVLLTISEIQDKSCEWLVSNIPIRAKAVLQPGRKQSHASPVDETKSFLFPALLIFYHSSYTAFIFPLQPHIYWNSQSHLASATWQCPAENGFWLPEFPLNVTECHFQTPKCPPHPSIQSVRVSGICSLLLQSKKYIYAWWQGMSMLKFVEPVCDALSILQSQVILFCSRAFLFPIRKIIALNKRHK